MTVTGNLLFVLQMPTLSLGFSLIKDNFTEGVGRKEKRGVWFVRKFSQTKIYVNLKS